MAVLPGELLRKKREAKNLTLEQVADGTNIRIHFLQAIEEDRMGAISSQAQYRGFLRLYASYLGLNPLELLEPVVSASQTVQPPEPEESLSQPTAGSVLDKVVHRFTKKNEEKPEQNLNVETELPKRISDVIFKEIGNNLQRQREDLGLSLGDIERQIKIREVYLYALENGLIDDLPSSVQGRGMLNNYAAFMSLDPEALQTRFAEGLQQRRAEKMEEEEAKRKNPELKKYNAPITGWRRYMTPDLMIGGGVFVVLVVLIIWGAIQVIGSSPTKIDPTAESISNILIATDTPSVLATDFLTPEVATTITPTSGDEVSTASVNLLATITAVANSPVQVVVVANQRAYLKITADDKEEFNGRVVPGSVYSFTASQKITLVSGNASAIQIYYNQEDLGILGSSSQTLNMDFTSKVMATVTPRYTASPTATLQPTYTKLPTNTPTVTSTPQPPTVTPYQP